MSVKKTNRAASPLDFGFAHVMPQAPDMEKAVLGALMIDKDAYLEVCDLLRCVTCYVQRVSMSQGTRWCMKPSSNSAWRRVLWMC